VSLFLPRTFKEKEKDKFFFCVYISQWRTHTCEIFIRYKISFGIYHSDIAVCGDGVLFSYISLRRQARAMPLSSRSERTLEKYTIAYVCIYISNKRINIRLHMYRIFLHCWYRSTIKLHVTSNIFYVFIRTNKYFVPIWPDNNANSNDILRIFFF
jgi:hypothetical protein